MKQLITPQLQFLAAIKRWHYFPPLHWVISNRKLEIWPFIYGQQKGNVIWHSNTLHWEQHSLLFGNSGAFGKYCLSFSQASFETTLRSFSDMHRSPAEREPRERLCSWRAQRCFAALTRFKRLQGINVGEDIHALNSQHHVSKKERNYYTKSPSTPL